MKKTSLTPLIKTQLADLHTPLSVYLKLANQPFSYLLESFQGGETWGRYSIVGLPATEYITVEGTLIQHRKEGALIESLHDPDPLAFIQTWISSFEVAPSKELPAFMGGLVGYFGYDTIRYIEKRLAHTSPPDVLKVPDIFLLLSKEFVVFDNLKNLLYLVVYHEEGDAEKKEAQAHLEDLFKKLNTPLTQEHLEFQKKQTAAVPKQSQAFQSNQTKETYEKAIAAIKEYILDGDVMQVVYSQRFSTPYAHSPLSFYRALRHINPSPYLFYFHFNDFYVVGSSPEILVRKINDTVSVRPIAGTRPRGKTSLEDLQLAEDLLKDEKELAEHLMLIDLGRNDVGRVSQLGSIRVTEKMIIERYSHVMHLVSHVEGTLLPNLCAMDALRATFPAGTLSGAPKIRAMEIIDELEPEKRSVYGGAVGYLGWNDQLDVAIAIRTALIKDGILYAQAGGGIVADSVPQKEWEETVNKASALFKAVEAVETHSFFETLS